MFTLSLLTSDMWAVLIRIFAYHEKVCNSYKFSYIFCLLATNRRDQFAMYVCLSSGWLAILLGICYYSYWTDHILSVQSFFFFQLSLLQWWLYQVTIISMFFAFFCWYSQEGERWGGPRRWAEKAVGWRRSSQSYSYFHRRILTREFLLLYLIDLLAWKVYKKLL